MTTYESVTSFHTIEMMDETQAAIIKSRQAMGHTYCGEQNEIDGRYCFLYLVFKKDEDSELDPLLID